MTRVNSFSGRAVFLGRFRALSVSVPSGVPVHLSAQTRSTRPGLNLAESTGYEQIGASLKDGSIEPSNRNAESWLAHPRSIIADPLAAYVSG
jgi:hypothetical protein